MEQHRARGTALDWQTPHQQAHSYFRPQVKQLAKAARGDGLGCSLVRLEPGTAGTLCALRTGAGWLLCAPCADAVCCQAGPGTATRAPQVGLLLPGVHVCQLLRHGQISSQPAACCAGLPQLSQRHARWSCGCRAPLSLILSSALPAEAVYVLHGSGVVSLGQHKFPVSEGCFVSYPPGSAHVAHQLRAGQDSGIEYLCFDAAATKADLVQCARCAPARATEHAHMPQQPPPAREHRAGPGEGLCLPACSAAGSCRQAQGPARSCRGLSCAAHFVPSSAGSIQGTARRERAGIRTAVRSAWRRASPPARARSSELLAAHRLRATSAARGGAPKEALCDHGGRLRHAATAPAGPRAAVAAIAASTAALLQGFGRWPPPTP